MVKEIQMEILKAQQIGTHKMKGKQNVNDMKDIKGKGFGRKKKTWIFCKI